MKELRGRKNVGKKERQKKKGGKGVAVPSGEPAQNGKKPHSEKRNQDYKLKAKDF